MDVHGEIQQIGEYVSELVSPRNFMFVEELLNPADVDDCIQERYAYVVPLQEEWPEIPGQEDETVLQIPTLQEQMDATGTL